MVFFQIIGVKSKYLSVIYHTLWHRYLNEQSVQNQYIATGQKK